MSDKITSRALGAADIAELRSLYARTSFAEEKAAPTWSDIKIGEDDDGAEYAWVPQCSYLGGTLIALSDTYEQSGDDCLYVQKVLAAVPALLDMAERSSVQEAAPATAPADLTERAKRIAWELRRRFQYGCHDDRESLWRSLNPVDREVCLSAARAVAPAGVPEGWNFDLSAVPKDGRLLRLLIEHGGEDDANPTADVGAGEHWETIGQNNLANTCEDVWEFAGWDWCQDCWTQGAGKVVAWMPFSAAPAAPTAQGQGNPDDIRAAGWAVAVHNDYRLHGQSHTFWLFTKGDRATKGEGLTDAEALNAVRRAIGLLPSAPSAGEA